MINETPRSSLPSCKLKDSSAPILSLVLVLSYALMVSIFVSSFGVFNLNRSLKILIRVVGPTGASVEDSSVLPDASGEWHCLGCLSQRSMDFLTDNLKHALGLSSSILCPG